MRKRQSGLPLHNSPPPQDWDLIESGGSPSTPWNASTSKEFSPKKRKKDTSLWISLGVFVVMLVVLVVIVVVKKRGHRLDVGSGAGSFTGPGGGLPPTPPEQTLPRETRPKKNPIKRPPMKYPGVAQRKKEKRRQTQADRLNITSSFDSKPHPPVKKSEVPRKKPSVPIKSSEIPLSEKKGKCGDCEGSEFRECCDTCEELIEVHDLEGWRIDASFWNRSVCTSRWSRLTPPQKSKIGSTMTSSNYDACAGKRDASFERVDTALGLRHPFFYGTETEGRFKNLKDYLNSRQIILSPNSETSLLFPPLKLKCYTFLPTLNIETSDNLYVKSFETLEHVKTARERMRERKNREIHILAMQEAGHPKEEVEILYAELEREWMSEGDWPDDDHVDNHYQVDHSIKQPYGDLTLLGQGRYRGVWLTPENDVYKTVYGYHSSIEYDQSHGKIEQDMDRISYYSSEIITQIELGNMKGKDTNVLGINGVGCDGGYDGSFTQRGGKDMILLRSYLAQQKLHENPKRLKLRLLIDAAKSLSQIHAASVVHVDVKTNQFVVDVSISISKPKVYLQDFNNAIYLDYALDKTPCPSAPSDHFDKSGKLRSPEEYNGLYLDTKIDIFAFAYVMYEVLIEEIPWRHEKRMRDENGHVVETRKAVAMGFMHPIHKEEMERWEIEVSKLIEDCWAYDAKDRPTAEEIVKRLQSI